MGKVTGFIEFKRDKQLYRPVEERRRDWRQVMLPWPTEKLQKQGARCMDCGIPFCHQGCPLGNLIPDWNDLVYRDRWREAIDRLHATNNFPEFTGTLCPAPCEGACVLGINDDPVTIKAIEWSIIEHAFDEGWIRPQPPSVRTGKTVAVVGSGPAGLAAAQQLNRAGHRVTVFERDDRIGGLLRYGIPEFKMEKRVLDRRLAQMAAEGVEFKTSCHVGVDLAADEIRGSFDAVLLCGGACAPRDLPIPGRDLAGVHYAMSYLTLQNRRCEGDTVADEHFTSAAGKRVVIIGGGDTGADCLGTVHRQGALSVHQFEILPRPPDHRAPENPWPLWPNVYRVSSAHEEGGERVYAVSTKRFAGDAAGPAEGPRGRARRAGSRRRAHELQGDRGIRFRPALRAGPPGDGVHRARAARHAVASSASSSPSAATVWRDERWMTSVPGVFTAGDMQRGQSLIVWAIAEGRSAARGVDTYLTGRSDLPAPLA